jgi:hypothetical protein
LRPTGVFHRFPLVSNAGSLSSPALEVGRVRLGLLNSCLFAVAVLALARAAGADERTDRDQARLFSARGAESLDAGHPAEALDWFQRAYDRFPSPRLHYNMAVALDELDRPALAIEQYEDFLSSETSDDDHRQYASERIGVLETRVARLDLEVSPHQATVRVDNRLVTLPRLRGISLAPGVVTIEAALRGYEPLTQDVKLAPGERRHLVVTLHPATSAVGAAQAATVPVGVAPAKRPPRRLPAYKKWWVWTIVGGALAAGAAVGLGVALSTKPASGDTTIPPFGPRAIALVRF